VKTIVLDSWAVIAWIARQPPAGEQVQGILDQAAAGEIRLLMSAINVGETYYALAKLHTVALAAEFRRLIPNMPVTVSVPTLGDIWRAAEAKRDYPISYADAFAASLAMHSSAAVLTGDPEFRSVVGLQLIWLSRGPQ
jgi:predicted nucleic acid-binding protein